MPALPAKISSEADETCPVCKQSRYLNPKMTFKINPECYHRMCDSCIDRIFMAGPAPCPVAGCSKTLRRARFRKQTFDDLTIERECDIRRYVNDILNKRETDFETLLAYNNYLQTKEDLTWNLIYSIDVEATRKQLAAFKADNRDEIESNKLLERAERERVEQDEDERKRRTVEAQEDLRRELAEERAARERESKSVGKAIMEASGDPEEAARMARERVVLKKSSAARGYRTEAQKREDDAARGKAVAGAGGSVKIGGVGGPAGGGGGGGGGGLGGLSFAGLKKAEVKAPLGPYDPFGGMKIETAYYTLKENGSYEHFFDKYKTENPIVAGGYDVRDYYVRALHEAHAGLGIIMSEEKAVSKS